MPALRHFRALIQRFALLMMPVLPLLAQQDTSGPLPDPHYVLHAYANRIQVPTLVVDSKNTMPTALERDRFTISLDSGPIFHPTQIRVEGDDPISLALVLDDSGGQTAVLAELASAMKGLTPQYLYPSDRISVYVADCKIFRTVLDRAISAPQLEESIHRAFVAPALHGAKTAPACSRSLRLWDTIAAAANGLAYAPGRRVMLVVSSGEDRASKISFRKLSEYLSSKSIAVFGLQDQRTYRAPVLMTNMLARTMLTEISDGKDPELTLALLCSINGGLVIEADHKDVESAVKKFVTFVRGRYILEFPAPDIGSGGVHNLDVKVTGGAKLMAFATGASSALPDAARLADPSTIKSSPSPAVFGSRKPLPPNP